MRESTQRLRQILTNPNFVSCHLYTFTLMTGEWGMLTDADVDIVAHGRIYDSTGPCISGARMELVRGLQVSHCQLTVLYKPGDHIAGIPWSIARHTGALDHATVRIDKAIMPDWDAPAETVMVFQGTVGTIEDGEQSLQLRVVSDANRLTATLPKLVFQPGCQRTLFAPGCDADRQTASAHGIVMGIGNDAINQGNDQSGTLLQGRESSSAEFATTLSAHDYYFNLGVVHFTSGLNTGVRRSVRNYRKQQGWITLTYPLEFSPIAGDHFIVRAGCDKTRGKEGCGKFFPDSQVIHKFKGMPYVPPPETAL